MRFRQTDPATGKRIRRAVTLTDDRALLRAVRVRVRLEAARRRPDVDEGNERAREVRKALRDLKRRILAASGRGRWLRRRLGRAFDIAAALGPETLDDFIGREPWKAEGKPGGRPRKALGGWVHGGGCDRGFPNIC